MGDKSQTSFESKDPCRLVNNCLIDWTLPLAAAAIASTVCTGRMGTGSDSSGDEPGAGAEGGTGDGPEAGSAATPDWLQKVGLLGSGMEATDPEQAGVRPPLGVGFEVVEAVPIALAVGRGEAFLSSLSRKAFIESTNERSQLKLPTVVVGHRFRH